MGFHGYQAFLTEFAFVALREYSEPIAAGGIMEYYWPNRGYAWFLNHDVHGVEWMAITRAVKKSLELAQDHFMRVEMTVRESDEKAKRWAEYLGFVCETPEPCRKLMNDGSDGRVYVMVY